MSLLWAAAILLPLLLALAVGVDVLRGRHTSERSTNRYLLLAAPFGAVPAVILPLWPGAADGLRLELDWLLLGTVLQLDGLYRPLLLVLALLYCAALIAVAWKPENRHRDLVVFLLLCHVGTTLVISAGDIATFYLGYSLMSFSAYGLVVHHRTPSAIRAGRIYIVLTVISEAAVLASMILTAAAGGLLIEDAPRAVAESDHMGLLVALLLIGFGVKAGTLPLHVWLPLAHPAAPPAASAVLSGAMVKVGIVGWLRFLPLGELAMPVAGTVLLVLALAGAFLAIPAGELQNDPKVVLAYSTISQMGFLAALVGAAMVDPTLAAAVMPAAIAYAMHHALAKATLFLGVPVFQAHRSGARRIVVAIGLTGAALAVAGAPFSSGALAKYAGKESVYGQYLFGVDLASLLPLVATGSTLLLLRFGWVMYRGPAEPRSSGDAELGAWLALVIAGLTLPWLLTVAWLPGVDMPALEAEPLWDATWPILLGLALGAIAVWLSWRKLLPDWASRADGTAVPPGDLVVPEERLAESVLDSGRGVLAAERRKVAEVRDTLLARGPDDPGRVMSTLESFVVSRPASALFLISVSGVLIWAGVA